ncbi:MAG TPA: hypothetical protein VEU76_10120, partial [Candidatus Udaeobacter sp.]|nr:hypothetical protein [Candidatus Udaeobacter sp.]
MGRGRWVARVGVALVAALLAGLVWIGRPVPQPRLASAIATPSMQPPAVAQPSPTPGLWDLDADIGSVMVLSWRASLDWSVVQPELVGDQIGG